MGVFLWWSHDIEQLSRFEAEQRLHLSLAHHLADDNPLLKQGGYDKKDLENMFHTLMVLGPSFEFYFIGTDGEILAYSADPGKIKRGRIDINPIKLLLNNSASLPVFGDDPRDLSRKKIFSAATVSNNGKLQGYLYIIIGSQIYDSIFSRIQLNQQFAQSIVLVLGAVILFFIVLLGLLRYLTNPLKALTQDIRNFRREGFDKSKVKLRNWPKYKNNEIHELGLAFNDMAEQIFQQLTQLKYQDKQRKELFSHLSHDLRTPLASLRGYLETVKLKGTTLNQQQFQRFIDIAFKNSNQLKYLIDQIFELSYLEGGETLLDMEQFPLTDLLYDIVAKYTFQLEEKNISIEIIPENSGFMIYSDVAKLERVLSNLVENAIRHAFNNGKIKITQTKIDDEKIELKVSDQGTGIPEEDIPHIFEPRYRGSNAINNNELHNGLGLAISQQLMRILKSEIKVESKVDKGSTFSIVLFTSDK